MSRTESYLLDMLIAARKAQAFCVGLTWEDFRRSEVHQYAVVKALEVIGEAARNIPQEAKDRLPRIPWQEIAGMRNRLIHEYVRIDLQTVWDTVQRDIPALIEQIIPRVPPE